ncbi:glycosyltransferase family 2 protein [Pelomonas sp. KK5]|uniref:glycosyltransferase family 2 protein n=1 Tax=Pelomonas sp. KK5 TaxID=1855730 RepID=UPI0009F8279F|nr:glycosyltransferase family 2 protein [Pelomonas sp. KK5]
MTEALAAAPVAEAAPPIPAASLQAPLTTPLDLGVTSTSRGARSRLPTLSCVIPCRNEAANLALLLPQLQEQLATCSVAWEIVLVDDGSTDDSAALFDEWSAKPGIVVLRLSRNFGKEAALTAGLEACGGEVVVMMDADLQHPPALIPSFVRYWLAGADVAYAVRAHRQDESAFKRWGSRFFYRLMNLADRFEVPPDAGDFRLIDRAVVRSLLALPERNRFMKGLYAWVGFDAVAVPYVPAERAHGRSAYRPLRLVGLALDGLTAFTTWPLRAVSAVGGVLAACAFVYGAYLSLVYLVYGHVVSGWTTIVVSLMLFSGIQLVSIGVLGEYVGRIFEEVKARPLYIVKKLMGRGLGRPGQTR